MHVLDDQAVRAETREGRTFDADAPPGRRNAEEVAAVGAGHDPAIGVALAVDLIGLVVWAVFLRDDEPNPDLPVPTGVPTSEPETTGSAGATGTTGTTGVTGSVSGATGASAATGASGSTGDGFTVETQLCESVNQNGRCLNAFPYDPASGWTIPVTAPSFTVLVTTEGLQPGDVISIDFNNVNANDETYYSTDLEPAPQEVVDYEQWIYWLPLVTPQTGSFPPGSATELVLYRNGEVITFQGPNVYTFS